jgi:hypothetical protein
MSAPLTFSQVVAKCRELTGAPVWPGTWSNEASAKMIRLDLAEARRAWIQAAAEDSD